MEKKLFTENDMRAAFDYYAFISQKPRSAKQVNADFKQFLEDLAEDKKMENKWSKIWHGEKSYHKTSINNEKIKIGDPVMNSRFINFTVIDITDKHILVEDVGFGDTIHYVPKNHFFKYFKKVK